MAETFDAAARSVADLVENWSRRLETWQDEADALVQRSEALRHHRAGVRQEQELAAAMSPDRQLVRPLLVVVPDSERSEGSPA
jgi:hypothetical protein